MTTDFGIEAQSCRQGVGMHGHVVRQPCKRVWFESTICRLETLAQPVYGSGRSMNIPIAKKCSCTLAETELVETQLVVQASDQWQKQAYFETSDTKSR